QPLWGQNECPVNWKYSPVSFLLSRQNDKAGLRLMRHTHLPQQIFLQLKEYLPLSNHVDNHYHPSVHDDNKGYQSLSSNNRLALTSHMLRLDVYASISIPPR